MATENAYYVKNGSLFWKTKKEFFAYLACYLVVLTAAFTSATGPFTGIPFLLSNIYPLNLIAYPAFIINSLIALGAVSAFTSFFSSYQDTFLPWCRASINFIHNLFLYIKGDVKTLKFSKENPNDIKVEIELELKKLENAVKDNKHHQAFLEWRLDKITKQIDRDKHNSLIDMLAKCAPKIKNEPCLVIKPRDSSTYSGRSKKFFKPLVNILSLLIVGVGCLVVVGIGIFTNLSFLTYSGIGKTAFTVGLCVTASIFKQACQLSFSFFKQLQVIPKLLQLETIDEKDPNFKLANIKHKLKYQKEDVHQFIASIEKHLAALEEDIKQQETTTKSAREQKIKQLEERLQHLDTELQAHKKVSHPILFMQNREKLIQNTMSEKARLYTESVNACTPIARTEQSKEILQEISEALSGEQSCVDNLIKRRLH